MNTDLEQLKRDKLADIIRRVMANPENLSEVVAEMTLDWFPMVKVNGDGTYDVIVGHGKKR